MRCFPYAYPRIGEISSTVEYQAKDEGVVHSLFFDF